MFESLLYWDRLACIVPFDGFTPNAYWPDDFRREADDLHEQFVTGLAPSDQVKAAVHDRLADLLDTEPPEWCRAKNLTPGDSSILAVRKISARTIDMLTENGWLARQQDDSLVAISHAASGVVLGALVEEMASETLPAVTDDSNAFRAACNGLLRELQSPRGLVEADDLGAPEFSPNEEPEEADLALVLARIVKLGVDDDELTPSMLKRLSTLRGDSGFNEQRERFCHQVDCYVSDLREFPISEHKVVHEHWREKLNVDRRGLKRELRSAGIRSITEKEGIIATGVGAAAGIGTLAAAGPVGLVVGLGIAGAGILDSTRRKRAEVAERHWTSWLFSASRSRLACTMR